MKIIQANWLETFQDSAYWSLPWILIIISASLGILWTIFLKESGHPPLTQVVLFTTLQGVFTLVLYDVLFNKRHNSFLDVVIIMTTSFGIIWYLKRNFNIQMDLNTLVLVACPALMGSVGLICLMTTITITPPKLFGVYYAGLIVTQLVVNGAIDVFRYPEQVGPAKITAFILFIIGGILINMKGS